ncbi:MAG: hypothetical protein K2P93_01365 [Alphaproteobacteria bacterium]|nr:hypothetical protein [Alphaproteobacteria bacterium]
MKLFTQAVDVRKCIMFCKKTLASLIIFSMLMIDVAKAMDEERSPAHVVQRIPLPKPPSSDLENSDSDSSLKLSPPSDDGDSSPGSISSSPESQKPGSGVEDQSLAIIPFVKLSLVPPQASIVSPSQSNPDETGRKSAPLPTSTHPNPSLFTTDSDDEFSLFEVGSMEQSRQSLIAGLPKAKAPTGSTKGAPSTAPPQVTSILPDSSAFLSMEVSYPQLHSNIGSSPLSGGSLQDRTPSYIPSPHIAPQSHNNNGKPSIPPQSNLVLLPTGSHPLEDSDTDSDADQGRVPLKPSKPLSTIQSQNEKKPSPNSSVPLLRSQREFSSASPVLPHQKPGTNIDAIIKALLPEDRSPNPLFPEEQHERTSSDSIQIDDEQSPLLQLSANGITYASIPVDPSRSEEFVLLGKAQDPFSHERKDKRSFKVQRAASNTPPPHSSSSVHIHQVSEKSPLLPSQSLKPSDTSIQAVDALYEEFELLGNDQDPPGPLGTGEAESRVGCCCNRPCWPQHTEYTLPNAQHKLQQLSQKLTLLRQVQAPHIIEGSGRVNGRAGQILEIKPLPHSDGQDESTDHSDSSGGSVDVSSSSNDNSPEKRGPPPLILVVGDQTDSDEEQGEFFLPANLLKDSQISSDEEEEQSLPVLPAKGSLSGSPHSVNSHQDEESEEEVVLAVVPSDLQSVFDNIADLEAGLNVQSQASFRSFCQDLQSYLKSLPAKTKAQLKDYVHQVLNGKSTWPQRLGKWGIGPIIALGFAIGMGPVYSGGVGYLSTQGEIFNELIKSSGFKYFIYYINLSALPDGVSRNAHLWKKGIAYLFQKGKEAGRMCLAGGISFLTAFIPVAYLISSENIGRQILQLPNWDNQFGIAVAMLGPPLYLDALASDFNTAWAAFPQMQEWLGKLFCRKSLHARLPSLSENPREKFDNDLKKLENFLFRAPPVVIDEIYGDIKQIKESLETSFCNKPDEDLATQQAFAAVSYLLSLGDEVDKGISKPKSIYDISADIFKYMCLVFGTPARALALQFIGYSVFSLFCPDLVAQILGGAYALLAFLPQTFMEDQGMDNFSKRFIFEEDPHGHSSYPTYRLFTKIYCAIQGLVYVFPLAILTLQASQQWFGNGWWPLVVGIPFLIPEFAAQTFSFNGTYNQQVTTAITNVHSTKTRKYLGKEPPSNWKRDWLIRFVEESRSELKQWYPDLIFNLKKTIEMYKQRDNHLISDEI